MMKATKTIMQLKLKFSLSNNLPSAYLQSIMRGKSNEESMVQITVTVTATLGEHIIGTHDLIL